MEIKEVLIIILASVILGFSVAFPSLNAIPSSVIYMLIIFAFNVGAKKLAAYHYEADTTIKFWEVYQYYWTKKSHFKKPMAMFWIAPVISIITLGHFLWLAILEFDIKARPERISRRHGIYRFTEMNDSHIAAIASAGVGAVLLLAIISYVAGFGLLTKLSVYFALWSLLPLSSLDGSKILFGSRVGWTALLLITTVFFSLSAFIV
jgi:hypothetical protein